tara:strand:- start:3750 stop:4964 length:1215 start_codon:yes stop_codon:yes gene_type:complete
MNRFIQIILLLLTLSLSSKSQESQQINDNSSKTHQVLKKEIERLKNQSQYYAKRAIFDSAFQCMSQKDSLENALQLLIAESVLTEKKGHFDKNNNSIKNETDTLGIILTFIIGTAVFVVILLALKKKNKETREINARLERKNSLIEKKNNEILDSILYAKKIQEAILTSKSYMETVFKEYFILYNPKDIISGDFYWAYNNDRTNSLYWATVDCTGHGVPGALMSMIGTVLLNKTVIVKKETCPNRILTEMNKYLKRYINKTDSLYHTQDGMDISFCKLNQEDLTLETAGAGQSIYIIRKNELIELKGDNITLGQDPLEREINDFKVQKFNLKPNDIIYTFTDGFTDQIGGPERKKIKVGALKTLLQEISELSLNEQQKQLQEKLSKWKGGLTQVDDILVMGVKV